MKLILLCLIVFVFYDPSQAFNIGLGYSTYKYGRRGENNIRPNSKETNRNGTRYSWPVPLGRNVTPRHQKPMTTRGDKLLFPESMSHSTDAVDEIIYKIVFEAPKKECPPNYTLDDLGNCREMA